MEIEKLKFGLTQHFPKYQWQKDNEYLKTRLEVTENDLEFHGKTVRTAFLNMKAFLNSINIRDQNECEETYDLILEEDPTNLNAWIGLYECTASPKRKQDCETSIDELMQSDKQKTAVPKALLEIGLALCLLIPRYDVQDWPLTGQSKSKVIRSLDGYENLEFITEKPKMEDELYIDTNIAQKKRVYDSLCYLQEGLFRFKNIQTQEDELVWKFFLGMSYNRLDNWIAYSNGSQQLRKQFTLKSLELFCELAVNLDPNAGDGPSRMYFQRCLAYIGQILVARKDVVIQGQDKAYVPECFQRYSQHFVRQFWENPTEAFNRATEYGYDAVVYTRNAKRLLYEQEYDTVIDIVDEIFRQDAGVHWYAASIRMTAYKRKYMECYKLAKKAKDFTTLTPDLLLKAKKDGKYCFDTFATANDVSNYATILLWLGLFPDGMTVTSEKKIRSALNVLNRLYKEEGCHKHFKIHKIKAECHAHLGELEEAMKYAIWSLNTTTERIETVPIAFSKLIEILLRKIEQPTSVGKDQKRIVFKQIKYYTENEIKRCLELIHKNRELLKDGPFEKILVLVENYDNKILTEVRETLKSDLNTQQNRIVSNICNRYDAIFSVLRKSCTNHAEEMKCLLEVTAELVSGTSLPMLATMCLICLGNKHKVWTQEYNKRWRTRSKANDVTRLELCSPTLEELPNDSQYDFLVIHAPEDKDWIFYTFLPEMEDRPKQFRGCIPDRDFKKGVTFEQNVKKGFDRTNKVLLVLTNKFFERVYNPLKDCGIIEELGQMHENRTIDAINVFAEDIHLDQDKYRNLLRFENVNASAAGFNWNTLRALLVRHLPPRSNKRPAVIWEDVRNNSVKPRESDDDKYQRLVEDVLPYGLPEAMYILPKKACIIGYDGERKVPRWVAHKIDSNVQRDEAEDSCKMDLRAIAEHK